MWPSIESENIGGEGGSLCHASLLMGCGLMRREVNNDSMEQMQNEAYLRCTLRWGSAG